MTWARAGALQWVPRAGAASYDLHVRFVQSGQETSWMQGPYQAESALLSVPMDLTVPAEVDSRLAVVHVLATAYAADGQVIGHHQAPLRFVNRSGITVSWLDGAEAESRAMRAAVPAGFVDDGVVGSEVRP